MDTRLWIETEDRQTDRETYEQVGSEALKQADMRVGLSEGGVSRRGMKQTLETATGRESMTTRCPQE